ncbi:MAG: mechanosensitive ion channel domain-containing protein [Rivularia sp. (in: cyanobacteria)]
MNALLDSLKNFEFLDLLDSIPIGKIIAVFLILVFTQFFRKLITNFIVRIVERFTAKTATTLDDELIEIFKPAISLIVLVSGIWLAQVVIADELGGQLTANVDKIINFILVLIVGNVIFRSASLLGKILADTVLRTETELDSLLRPFVPKVFQTIAIMLIIIKMGEIFLGASAGALIGLLGGAGITIGLLFKDIVYDWFCTVIIYIDKLYKEGDWVFVTGIDGFVQVIHVGFRSTTLKVMSWGCVQKMPNSQMISGIVQNWSQPAGNAPLVWGLNLTLKIDGISAAKTAKICQSIRDAIPAIEGMYSEYVVRFSHVEENARVIAIKAFVEKLNLYYVNEEKLNLAILEILEQEGLDTLHVQLETEPENYQKTLAAINN